ncbi:hypothetical protein HMSSN036_13330 [Paenibacillus macerans]|nr:hypothetical protein HMSSN036_13330 [Paenibacillus macerans]
MNQAQDLNGYGTGDGDQTAGPIPVLDLKREVAELKPRLLEAIEAVLDEAAFIMGNQVKQLEREAADYLGVRHAIALNSGTDALVIALLAAGIGPGDEVITTPFTFFATAEAISRVQAVPVFADVDPATFNLNPDSLEAAITPRTKALLPVHLFGRPAEMDRIMDIARAHGLIVIEDAAQAFGAETGGRKAGTIGNAGCYSFFPSKISAPTATEACWRRTIRRWPRRRRCCGRTARSGSTTTSGSASIPGSTSCRRPYCG